MNGERAQVNGQQYSNGVHPTSQNAVHDEQSTKEQSTTQPLPVSKIQQPMPYTNGVSPNNLGAPRHGGDVDGLDPAPLEVLQLIGKDNYLPIATLINRSAQSCWNGLRDLVDQLSTITVPEQPQDSSRTTASYLTNGVTPNNQTKANLDKKDRILNFANDQKANFVKLLVLLQWSRDVDDVAKTIELNFWLNERRRTFWEVTHALAILKRDSTSFQIPNPDLKTAAQVLALGRVPSYPDIGYRPQETLTSAQILSVLRRLNHVLCINLTLHTDLPSTLQNYRIHDGRATFLVSEEFELDVSVMSESSDADFRVVDFRFVFSPTPSLPDSLHAEIERIANSNIDRDGLKGCYDFFHDLALSQKVAQYHRQALSLSRNQWTRHLKVEFLRRTLVIQYWPENPMKKSWIEVGIVSGRNKDESQPSVVPFIGFRWFREGVEVVDLDLEVDLSNLSLENILSQIIAQHSNHVLSLVYDRLLMAPIFANSSLSIEQSSSFFDPLDCYLEAQISRTETATFRFDPVSGRIIMNPISGTSDRLQLDLNRSKNLIDEFVPRFLQFRCILADAIISEKMSNTSWQALPAIRPTSVELRSLFGGNVNRINFYHQSCWSNEYLLALWHSLGGDRWSLIKQSTSSSFATFADSRIVRSQPLDLHAELTAEYFEALAGYTSGLIVLEMFTSQLSSMSLKHQAVVLPPFELGYHLPDISFDLDSNPPLTVIVEMGGIDLTSNLTKIFVTFRSHAGKNVLAQLATSNSDSDVQFIPQKEQIRLQIHSVAGNGAVSEIVQRVKRLNDLISCIKTVQTLTNMAVETLSTSAMTISYQLGHLAQMRLRIRFATTETGPSLDFLPADTNPHKYLEPQLTQLLRDQSKSFAINLTSLLSSLTITQPIVVCLHEMQQLLSKANQTTNEANKTHNVRLHILIRQPTMFALHFFSTVNVPRAPKESLGPEVHPHLLARFEIIPQLFNGRNTWLLRPAVEEFNAYIRPSYCSDSLRSKVRELIFAKKDPLPDWLCLDTAAVCLAGKPEALLESLQKAITGWVQSTHSQDKPEAVSKAETAKPQPSKGPASNTSTVVKPSNKAASQAQLPNGGNSQQKARPMISKPNQMSQKHQEIITLD